MARTLAIARDVTRIGWIDASTALVPTGGFLGDASGGFTHSFSPAIGCVLGRTSCGIACYAQFLQAHRVYGSGAWGEYVLVKRNAAEVIARELARAADREVDHPAHVSRIRVFSASSTEPLAGPCYPVYRECLRAVAKHRVGAWVIQTRSPLVARLVDEIAALGSRAVVSVTIETDDPRSADLGAPGTPTVRARMSAVETLAASGIAVHVAVSPALPVRDELAFADWIAAHAAAATVDTFTDGDGAGGGRTRRTALPAVLEARGVDWRDAAPARSLHAALRARMGDRAGWSRDGFRRLATPETLVPTRASRPS
ncbi:MAG TPA: radical SAM protein [Planctomycetota bacterium]|nr:radical SAM protein [Planctomycetota bacterium]